LPPRVRGLITAAVALAVIVPIGEAKLLPGHQGLDTFNGREAAADYVVVKFKSTPTAAQLAALASEIDADSVDRVGGLRAHLMHSRSKRVAELVAQLASRADLEYVEPDYVVYAITTPNDPSFPNQWALRNVGQAVNGYSSGHSGADVQATAAWDIATGSPANVVGIVDTAVDVTHPDLAPNIWSAPASFSVTIAGKTVACPAGTPGFESQSGILSCGPGAAMQHATHVAGIIGAAGNNQQGVSGINWRASMMSLNFMPNGSSGYTSDAINAIEFAIQMKARFAGSPAGNVRVLNNSWGGAGFSQALQDEIDRAAANDIMFVAAAGNSGANLDATPDYPASFGRANMLNVASSNAYEQLSTFSNYGQTTVHLAAPGENILSTLPGAAYGYLSGTSMAAPMVSGAAVLVLSRCPMNTSDLKSLLLNSVDHLAQYAARVTTGGRLNVARALQTCAASSTDAPPTVALTSPADGATYTEPGTVQLVASAADSDGSVVRVDFYAGSALIGSATWPPYTTTWTNVPVGTYTLTAVATDNLGAQTRSATITVSVVPAGGAVPAPWVSQDVGATGIPGAAWFASGTFTLQGAGADIWGPSDAFQFVNQTVTGDAEIVARVTAMSNTNAYAKAGVMIRESAAANAANVILDVRPTGDIEFMARASTGSFTGWIASATHSAPAWLKLSRSGSTVSAFVSSDGSAWQAVGTTSFSIAASALVGLAVTSHDSSKLNTANFDNVSVTTGGAAAVPPPWTNVDVGATGRSGSASYAGGTFTVKGAGADIWSTADAFQFVNQTLAGDGQIVARVVSLTNTNAYAKAGVMIRETTAANAAHVVLDVRPTGDVEFMTRTATGASTTWIAAAVQPPAAWLRLARTGSLVTASISADGSNWTAVGSTNVSMGATPLVGLVVTSHDTTVLNTATFDQVAVSPGSAAMPAPWTSQDVGNTGRPGSASFASGTFTVRGAGADIWGTADAFQYVSQPMNGDGRIVARVLTVGNTNTFAKAGVMMRESTAANAADVILDVRPNGNVEFMTRGSNGAFTAWLAGATQSPPVFLKLERTGSTVTGSISADGVTWQQVGQATLSSAAATLGLVVTSHDPSLLNTSTFDQVAAVP
jgi:regulation of enolase protein 1 (concanavalin A-like superfamily)